MLKSSYTVTVQVGKVKHVETVDATSALAARNKVIRHNYPNADADAIRKIAAECKWSAKLNGWGKYTHGYTG